MHQLHNGEVEHADHRDRYDDYKLNNLRPLIKSVALALHLLDPPDTHLQKVVAEPHVEHVEEAGQDYGHPDGYRCYFLIDRIRKEEVEDERNENECEGDHGSRDHHEFPQLVQDLQCRTKLRIKNYLNFPYLQQYGAKQHADCLQKHKLYAEENILDDFFLGLVGHISFQDVENCITNHQERKKSVVRDYDELNPPIDSMLNFPVKVHKCQKVHKELQRVYYGADVCRYLKILTQWLPK